MRVIGLTRVYRRGKILGNSLELSLSSLYNGYGELRIRLFLSITLYVCGIFDKVIALVMIYDMTQHSVGIVHSEGRLEE